MKRSPFFHACMALVAIIAGAFIAACTIPPNGAPSAAASATFNDGIGYTIQTVTAARKVSTSLLLAGKITVDQDRRTQSSLDLVRASLVAARALHATDPAQAQALADQASKELAAVQAPPASPIPASGAKP